MKGGESEAGAGGGASRNNQAEIVGEFLILICLMCAVPRCLKTTQLFLQQLPCRCDFFVYIHDTCESFTLNFGSTKGFVFGNCGFPHEALQPQLSEGKRV